MWCSILLSSNFSLLICYKAKISFLDWLLPLLGPPKSLCPSIWFKSCLKERQKLAFKSGGGDASYYTNSASVVMNGIFQGFSTPVQFKLENLVWTIAASWWKLLEAKYFADSTFATSMPNLAKLQTNLL